MANIIDLTSAQQIEVLGKGADGVARLFSKGTKKYVVKTLRIKKGKVVSMDAAEELNNEREQHLGLWAQLRPDEKQYFFEPYLAQLNETKYPGPNHTMNYIPGLEEAHGVGYALYQSTKNGTPADAARLKSFIRKIQKGVLAMWRAGMVHADMHLSNVLCNKDASIVKIIDFGRSASWRNNGLNITQNNLTTNKLKNPPQKWKDWWIKAIGAWDAEFRKEYGGGNPEGYVFGLVNKNRFFAKSSFNYFTYFRRKVNTNAKFKTIKKPSAPKSLSKKSPGRMVPIANIVQIEEKKIPKLVDRIAAIAKKARAQQKQEALNKIERDLKVQRKKCKQDAKAAATTQRRAVDKKFGSTPELRRKAILRANKVQKMVAIRKAFVRAAKIRKAVQAYLPQKAKPNPRQILANKSMKQLKQIARNKGFVGFSKYATRVDVLRKFVGNKMFPNK